MAPLQTGVWGTPREPAFWTEGRGAAVNDRFEPVLLRADLSFDFADFSRTSKRKVRAEKLPTFSGF